MANQDAGEFVRTPRLAPPSQPRHDQRYPVPMPRAASALVLVQDPEALRESPIEIKHVRLARGHRSSPGDRALKPNPTVRHQLNVRGRSRSKVGRKQGVGGRGGRGSEARSAGAPVPVPSGWSPCWVGCWLTVSGRRCGAGCELWHGPRAGHHCVSAHAAAELGRKGLGVALPLLPHARKEGAVGAR